jgi:DNA-binding transcriptional ArsR family regulator
MSPRGPSAAGTPAAQASRPTPGSCRPELRRSLRPLRVFGTDFGYNIRTMDRSRAHGLRVLGYLLQGGMSSLSASEQAVYLRLVWLCGLRSGTCRCGVERLVAWTGLSRTTVLSALRRLRDRGLLRPYTREPKRETAWLVEVPEPALPGLPEGLQEAQRPAGWLVDRMDPEDLELALGLLDSLPPSRREELEREVVEQFGDLDPEELQKAVLELVARRSFGPARLGKYGL